MDFTPSDLRNARAVALAGIGETILTLAEPLTKPAAGQPAPGNKYGVTVAKFAELDELNSNYGTAVGAPASASARRKALTDALPGQFAAVEDKFAELDDLIIQFRGTEAGDRFGEAWLTGRRAAKPNVVVSINSTSSTANVKVAKRGISFDLLRRPGPLVSAFSPR